MVSLMNLNIMLGSDDDGPCHHPETADSCDICFDFGILFFPDNSVIPSSDSVVNVCISDEMNDYGLTSPLVSLPFADDPSFLFFSLICDSYNFLSDVGLCS